jgi:hypothetical protein
MAKDPKRVLERLFERNPDVESEELRQAFVEAVRDDKELNIAIASDVFNGLYPIVEKQEAGKPLTAGETAYLKIFSGKSVTDAERALAEEYHRGLKVQSLHN